MVLFELVENFKSDASQLVHQLADSLEE